MFRYYVSQREAVETLVYLYEVARIRTQNGSPRALRHKRPGIPVSAVRRLRPLRRQDGDRQRQDQGDGAGHRLAVLQRRGEGRDDYATTFLVVAPNVIVFERLRTDFGGGAHLPSRPVIPPELRIFWDFDCYMRGDSERG